MATRVSKAVSGRSMLPALALLIASLQPLAAAGEERRSASALESFVGTPPADDLAKDLELQAVLRAFADRYARALAAASEFPDTMTVTPSQRLAIQKLQLLER